MYRVMEMGAGQELALGGHRLRHAACVSISVLGVCFFGQHV
jgi:hypothetical protein